VRAAAFLDRDGVLNELVADPLSGTAEAPLKVEDVRLVAGAAAAGSCLVRAGYALVCISNQPAAAKGEASLAQLLAVHERVSELLAHAGVTLDASRLCFHHAQGVVPELTGSCVCRKPEPGMLLDAAAALGVDLASSWMVGDTDADMQAGRAAGCRTVLIRHPGSFHKRSRGLGVDAAADSLADAVEQLVSLKSETFT